MIDKIQQIIQQVITQEVGNNDKIGDDLARSVTKETGISLISFFMVRHRNNILYLA